jgi:hypothetical protein
LRFTKRVLPGILEQLMGTTIFRTTGLRWLDPDVLSRVLARLAQSTLRVADGIEFSPRAKPVTISITDFADRTIVAAEIEQRWRELFPDSRPVQLELGGASAGREKAEERLRTGKFTNFWWPLNTVGPQGFDANSNAERHGAQMAIIRDVLLPSFFTVHPDGRVLAVSYQDSLKGYLAGVSVLRRAQRISDPKEFEALIGKNSLAALRINVVPELLQHCITLAFAASWPTVHGIVAMVSHECLLVFLLPEGTEIASDEGYPLFQMDPGLGALWEYNPPAAVASLKTAAVFTRRRPFDRAVKYPVPDLVSYVRTTVTALGETIGWISDLPNFPIKKYAGAGPPDVDLDFALHAYLTLYVLVVKTLMLTGGNLAFERKMQLFDILDLHAGLVNASPGGSSTAFNDLAGRGFSDSVLTAALNRYPGRMGSDLMTGLKELRAANRAAVKGGIIYGLDAAENVTVPGAASPTPLDDFEVQLLRALRNTKHGYAIQDSCVLGMHTAAIHDDFPDYAIALALGLFADRSYYTLLR